MFSLSAVEDAFGCEVDFAMLQKIYGTHQTLRVTPAMEAGVADHVWSIEEILAVLRGIADIARRTRSPNTSENDLN